MMHPVGFCPVGITLLINQNKTKIGEERLTIKRVAVSHRDEWYPIPGV